MNRIVEFVQQMMTEESKRIDHTLSWIWDKAEDVE
jgi:hypothetical protein